MEDIDYDTPRNLNRNQMERLATLEFVRAGQDVFIIGPTGTGKSTLAEALAHRACENGMRTYYASAPKLMNKLKGAKAKGTYDADMKKIEKSALLVLDDLFILGLDSKERAILLDIIEDRHGRWVDDNNVTDTSRRMV
jgi:DNA replication protein DnaC